MPIPLNDLKKRFILDDSVQFADLKEDEIAKFCLGVMPISYRKIKETFGNSRLHSDTARFWISSAQDENPNYSITALQEMLDERLEKYHKRNNENWLPVNSRDAVNADLKSLTLGKLVPLFCNSEYDYWLCWNLGRVDKAVEPEVIYFDFGLQKLFGRFIDLVAVYEALSEGHLVEELPKDKKGMIKLTAFETW